MIDMTLLTILFFFVALLYSMVGFGGGSSYIALLILFGVSYTQAPTIALICNIIVVLGGFFHSFRNRNLSFKTLLPFLITSVPFAYLGGLIPLPKLLFQSLLGLTLLTVALKMIFYKRVDKNYTDCLEKPPFLLAAFFGMLLGFLSGLVGIGGGIFLAPLLYLFKWGRPKQIAGTASGFILFNSLAGFVGQVSKHGNFQIIQDYWPMMLAVLLGGQLGSILGHQKIPQRKIEVLTSYLILFVSTRILWNCIS